MHDTRLPVIKGRDGEIVEDYHLEQQTKLKRPSWNGMAKTGDCSGFMSQLKLVFSSWQPGQTPGHRFGVECGSQSMAIVCNTEGHNWGNRLFIVIKCWKYQDVKSTNWYHHVA